LTQERRVLINSGSHSNLSGKVSTVKINYKSQYRWIKWLKYSQFGEELDRGCILINLKRLFMRRKSILSQMSTLKQ
jgi:hypothetical protein